jgi:hypothetical protein
LNSSTGQISGIPTAPGTSNFTILVTDSYDLGATMAFALTINPPPLIVTQSLPNGTVGVNYAQTVVATGGTPPLVWNYTGTLPAGLLLNSGSGLISGIPTAAGTSNFTILVSDSYGVVASQALSITTYLPLTITTNSPLPGATDIDRQRWERGLQLVASVLELQCPSAASRQRKRSAARSLAEFSYRPNQRRSHHAGHYQLHH